MLLKLHIKNFALIDDIELDFKDGLNIMTGETGAGKSIIIDAIYVIIGERSSSDLIRTGQKSLNIQAVFSLDSPYIPNILEDFGIDMDDDLIIIEREITKQGRNICRINGKIVPVSALRRLGSHLIDIHGQHQHQSLLNSANHLELLDSFGAKELGEIKDKVRSSYFEYRAIEKQIKDIEEKNKDLIRMKEQINYEIDEIEKAKIVPDEDIKLKEEKEHLENAEKIYSALEIGYSLLYKGDKTSSVIDNLNRIINVLDDIKTCFKSIEPKLSALKNILYELEDHALELKKYKDMVEFDPARLDEIYSRLQLLDRLKSKYNMSLNEILKYKEAAAARIYEAEDLEEELNNLKGQKNIKKEEYIKNAILLHEFREKTARILEKEVARELSELGMKSVSFSVNLTYDQDESGININGKNIKITKEGFDNVEFLISTNPGEPLKPLAKIVSGGETSRIMLALKNILAKVDMIPCMIFDEIDTGIGGRTAQIVGEKLAKVAINHQVICVTHSPQIASLGDVHYLIKKQVENGRTYTSVFELNDWERINELSRMLGGAEITENTQKHAKEMLDMAQKIKKNQRLQVK